MHTSLVTSAFALTGVLWLTLACSDGPATATPTATPGLPPIEITVSSDKASYLQGEPIRLDVTLRDVTPYALTIHFPPLVRLQRVEGPPAQVLVAMSKNQRVLLPDKPVSMTVRIPDDAPSLELPPGRYVVFAQVEFSYELVYMMNFQSLEVSTEPFVVQRP